MNEFALIQQFFQHGFIEQPSSLLGIGDDCSIIRPEPQHDLVQSVDTQVADLHFPAQAPAHLIAARALRCAASDLAAMGARAHSFHLALTLPEANEAWLQDFSLGLKETAAALNLQLLGGDTTRGPQLVITIAVQGWVPQGQALTRQQAQIGDDVWVSGKLGAAALALADVLQQPSLSSGLAEQYYFPTVHLPLGQALLGKANACMDISDGLLQDASHLARASQVTLALEAQQIPTQVPFSNPDWLTCLTAGDDYQLLFTAPNQYHQWLTELNLAQTQLHCIGRVRAASQQALELYHQGQLLEIKEPCGFQHF